MPTTLASRASLGLLLWIAFVGCGDASNGDTTGAGGDGPQDTGGRSNSGGTRNSGGSSVGGAAGADNGGSLTGGRGGSGGGSAGGSGGRNSGGRGGSAGSGGSGGSGGGSGGSGGGSGGSGNGDLGVELVDDVVRSGVECFLVRTESADYYFDKAGAGLVSVVDASGRDWVSWSRASSHYGDYRGIPNMGPCCHPGYTGARTTVTAEEPDRVVLRSVPEAGSWETRWEFRPDHARLTVVKPPGSYYLLYEGTPGGTLGAEDRIGFPDGRRVSLATGAFLGDLPDDEWVYFVDTSLDRALLVLHPQDDTIADTYWTFDTMTVFGFGRTCKGGCTGMTRAGDQLVIALTDETSHASISSLADRLR